MIAAALSPPDLVATTMSAAGFTARALRRGGPEAARAASKVPPPVAAFWVAKILATTLGETGGDTVSTSFGLGYGRASLLLAALLVAAIAAQLASRAMRPALYWTAVVATATTGTTIADLCDRSLGIGYAGGTLILGTALLGVLALWRAALGAVGAARIVSPAQEAFYWAAILAGNTLGTALGDWTADGAGLGFGGAAAVFGILLALLAVARATTRVPATTLFWAAFVLTRPLGAALGDLLTKPVASGGFGLDRVAASLLLAAAMILCIRRLPRPEPPAA